MKRLVIIEHEPLTPRLSTIWNVNELRQSGVDLEYWDMSQLIYPERVIPGVLSGEYIHQITSFAQFTEELDRLDLNEVIFVLEIFPVWENRKIIKALQDRGARCIKIDLYANTTLPQTKKEKIKNFFRKGFFHRSLRKLQWSLYSKQFLHQIYEFTVSSSKAVSPRYLIHHPDYEAYIRDAQPILTDPYILFVDVFYPLHPDHSFAPLVTAEWVNGYRSLMMSFFDYLEKKYGLPVVIAAHPKARYTGDEFGDRKILSGKSGNLIRHASIVISHESNSLSYISLADKPVAFVYPDTYKRHMASLNYITKLAALCGKEAYNLNETRFEDIVIERIPDKIRKHYVDSFITSAEAGDMTNADIFIRILNEN